MRFSRHRPVKEQARIDLLKDRLSPPGHGFQKLFITTDIFQIIQTGVHCHRTIRARA